MPAAPNSSSSSRTGESGGDSAHPAETETLIEARINGEPREVPAGLTIGGLLLHLDVRAARVAVERNRGIVSKASYDSTMVEAGDEIEIVTFIGGG